MTAQIIEIRDYQQRRDLERMYNESGNDCAIAASIALIPHDREIDTAPSEYCAPDQDSA